MKYKKSMIMLVLVIFLFSIASVSASDVDDSSLASEDINQMELSASDEITEDNIQTNENILTQASTDETVSASNELDVLGSSTYADLIDEIMRGGNTVELQDDYYTYGDTPVTIQIDEDNKIIDGKGAVIDMTGSSTFDIFSIDASNVTIKNLTIKNVKEGRIHFGQGSSGTIENCNFINNTANDAGSAIYFNSGSTGTVTNCNFTNNQATYGGAVYFYDTGAVTNCNFTGNKATVDYSYGGAIYMGSGTVSNCNFADNEAYYGGAIRFNGEGTVSNCNFTGNKATGTNSWGGAIYMGSGTVSNCNFADNEAYHGGAVFFFDTGEVKNCNFTDNTATGDGGAIYFLDQGTVTNCNFTGNTATGTYSYGGAVFFKNYGNVTNCNFTGNTATVEGGAINIGSGTVSNCNFTNNQATGSNSLGGAVYFIIDGDVRNCNFTGNTATLGGAVFFLNNGNVINCNFTDNEAFYGGAIRFNGEGNVTNCNFTGNTATGDGGAINIGSGTVSNCNFTGNKATGTNSWGGAIRMNSGTVSNCNFTGNKATGTNSWGGAVYFIIDGDVRNCNFTDNEAYNGGAVYFQNTGTVSNCNFTANHAVTGSAIYFYGTSATKTVSNSRFLNNRANAETLEVIKNDNNITITFTGQNNLLNAIYSRDNAEVTFNNVTYWGKNGITTISTTKSGFNKEEGQNITVGVVVNDKLVLSEVMVTDENGQIVLDIITGNNYYIGVRHGTDSYYTEAERTISNNTKFNVNVTSQTTHNRTVNITAKSNIPNDVVKGKLLFILPNGTEINATYSNNGTWWAEYTFNECGVYHVNASYIGLSNVTINNATISINKSNSTIDLDDITLSYAESRNVTVTATGATGITAKINGTNVTVVNNFTIPISDLGAGNYTLTVTTIADGNHNPVTATSKITVNKINSTLTVGNIEFEYGSEGSGDVSFTGAGAVIANVINQPKAVVNVNGKKITVSGLAAGTYTLNVTTVPDENHIAVSQTAAITVNKVNSTLMVDDVVLNYGDSINVTVTATGATGITAKINGTNVTVVNNFTVPISDLGAGNYTLTVTTIVDGNHNPVTATSKITVNKVDSTLTVDNIEFEYGSEGSGDVSFNGAGAVIANVINQPKAVVNVNGKKITVSGLAAGTYTLNVTTVPDENHTAVSQTAAITVNKVNSSLTVDDVELYYGESKNVTVTVEGASGITAKIDGNAVGVVDNLTIPISGLNAGNHTLTVTTIADANHNSVTKEVKITVNKASTEIILANETIYLKAGNKISDVAKLDPGDAGNLTFVSSDEDIALAYDGTIWARIKGNATVTVSFEGNDNYEAAKNKTITVYITPKDTSVSVENDTLYLKVNETYEFDPAVVPNFLAIEYLSGNESVARVTEYGLLRAVGEGKTIITLTVGDDVSYAVNTTNVTVIVSKVPVEITVDNDSLDLKVGDETVISAALTPADAGNVTFTSSNDSVVEVDDEGNVIAQGKGQAIITVSFAGDNKYAASQNKTVTVNVSLDDASVTVDNDTLDLKVGETCAINATKHPDTILLDITYTSSDNSVVTVDEKGIVRAVGEGSAIITVEVGDDEIYALNSTNVTVKVSKIPTEITLTNESLDLMYNDIAGNLANLTPAGAGNLTFVSDNEDIVAVEDGYVIAVGAGKANVTVSFAGNDKYASAENKTIKVTVTAWDASVNVTKTSYELFIGESDTIVATTVPEGLKVRFESDDDEIISVDNNGKITALKKGNAIVYVSVGDNVVYKYDYAIVNVTVNKIPTEIASSSVSAVYNADKYLIVNLTDAKGNPLAGVNVNVDLNGAKNYTTDEKGQIKVSLKGLDPKTYAAGITFKGDAKYDGSAKDVNVTVKKATPKITAGAKTFKTTAKTKKYTITLKDNTGKAIKNAKVTLKVNGKTYKATTNSKGKATFKITKLNKEGSYKATVTYNGNKYYNKVTKKVGIKVISAWKTVSKGSKLKSTVKEIQRALKNNGYYLTEKGHYLMVDGIYWDYTVKAVKQFQKAKGLKATGKVDEKTAKKLKII